MLTSSRCYCKHSSQGCGSFVAGLIFAGWSSSIQFSSQISLSQYSAFAFVIMDGFRANKPAVNVNIKIDVKTNICLLII